MKTYIVVTLLTLVEIAKKMDSSYVAPSMFVNHRGVLGEKEAAEIVECSQNVSRYVDFQRLKAFVIVTAHREEDIVTISSGKTHSLFYSYDDFPKEQYKFEHNASGDPILAARIHEAFKSSGIPSTLEPTRGWDLGVFIPMILINPTADIPIVQVSILKNFDSEKHYEIGEVLHQFRKEGVMIIGSGLSYHNVEEFYLASVSNDRIIANDAFDNFLNEVCTGDVEQKRNILNWEQVPGALEAHPRGLKEHIMPLIANVGASGLDPGKRILNTVYLKKFRISGFLWDTE